MGIKGAAKIYAGELIEGARKVQAQWDALDEEAMRDMQARTGCPLPEGVKRKFSGHKGPILIL